MRGRGRSIVYAMKNTTLPVAHDGKCETRPILSAQLPVTIALPTGRPPTARNLHSPPNRSGF